MNIRFSCSECGKDYKVSSQYAGKKVKCKKCGVTVRVPEASTGSADAEDDDEDDRDAAADAGEEPGSGRAAKPEAASGTSHRAATSAPGSSSKRPAEPQKSESSKRAPTSAGSTRTERKATEPKDDPKDDPRDDPKDEPKDEPKAPKERKSSGKSPTGTAIIDVTDIQRELKTYERKKKDDDKKLDRGTGRLVHFKDKKPLKSFRLDGEAVTIGSGEKCVIRLPDEGVSKEHVRLEVMLGKFIATDQKSTNGMVVNGRSVRRATLKDGDLIQLGAAILRIDCG